MLPTLSSHNYGNLSQSRAFFYTGTFNLIPTQNLRFSKWKKDFGAKMQIPGFLLKKGGFTNLKTHFADKVRNVLKL
jgi:hypothetical protein